MNRIVTKDDDNKNIAVINEQSCEKDLDRYNWKDYSWLVAQYCLYNKKLEKKYDIIVINGRCYRKYLD